MTKLLNILILLLLIAAPLSAARAGALAAATGKTEETKETPAEPIDQWGRSTPRGLVEGFLNSIAKEDYEKAAQYLDLSKFSAREQKTRGPVLAKNLQTLLDKGGWFFPASMLSNAREGRIDEATEEDVSDVIGNLRGNGKTVDIVAALSKDENGAAIWLISADTLSQMNDLLAGTDDEEPLVNKALPAFLENTKWFGAPAGHWIAAVLLVVASYIVAWFLIYGIVQIGKKFWTRKAVVNGTHILDAIRVPASLYLAVWVFGLSALWLGISIIVRQHFGQLNVIVAWTAIALFAWRLVDIFAEATQRRIGSNGRFYGFSSILYFFRRIIKVAFGVIVAFILLDNLGVDVTAGLAALGIGGIALALGAQKTLENFIGSLAIVIDQPIHIGDFCKIGAVSGTVEDIGMRSTRLRTNDRTLVTIPNGDLSNQTIENYARRSRFLINKQFQLRYDATSAQISDFLQQFEAFLFSQEQTDDTGLPVRYIGPGSDGHIIEMFFYINVTDYNEFLKIQQGLMMKMMDIIADLGLFYVIPSQTMLPAVDQRGAEAGVPAAPVNLHDRAALATNE